MEAAPAPTTKNVSLLRKPALSSVIGVGAVVAIVATVIIVLVSSSGEPAGSVDGDKAGEPERKTLVAGADKTKESPGKKETTTARPNDKAPREPDKKETKAAEPKPPVAKELEEKDAPVVVTDGRLPTTILDQVKKATVYLRVTMPDGAVAQGSGFFGLEPGIVLTNAHVLGMLQADSRLPQRIEVVMNSGTLKEKTSPGKVLGVDRTTDLAVLRVEGQDLPAPLSVRSAKKLGETESVFVFGFPLGDQLGRNISVRKSSVSALRLDAEGNLEKVQVEGGIDPGNSGGPVVDGRGQVVGVAVSKIMDTQLNFAVPGDFVRIIVNGRTVGLTMDPPFKSGSAIKMQVRVTTLDPLNRMRNVSIDVWIGKSGKKRPASATRPNRDVDDSAREKFDLTYKNGVASGLVTLPELPVGKTYWIQPVYVNGLGEKRWVEPVQHNPGSPIERKPALLTLKHVAGQRPLTVTSAGAIKLVDSLGESHQIQINMEGRFTETTRSVGDDGTADIRLSYSGFRLGVLVDGKLQPSTPQQKEAVRNTTLMAVDLVVDRRGRLVRHELDLSRVPEPVRQSLTQLHQQIQKSLEAIAVPLLDKEAPAGAYWTAQRPLAMFSGGGSEQGVMILTYRYLGARIRDGREEAVITMNGVVRGPAGRELRLGGKAGGTAALDVASGQIARADVSVAVDLDMTFGRSAAKANGTLNVKLERGVAPAKKPMPLKKPEENEG
jgi:S1-C subfamily serine protease